MSNNGDDDNPIQTVVEQADAEEEMARKASESPPPDAAATENKEGGGGGEKSDAPAASRPTKNVHSITGESREGDQELKLSHGAVAYLLGKGGAGSTALTSKGGATPELQWL